jgi:hypothetical protein
MSSIFCRESRIFCLARGDNKRRAKKAAGLTCWLQMGAGGAVYAQEKVLTSRKRC